MGIDNNVHIVGNVTRDPELRHAQSGMAIANIGIAWNKRKRDGEDEVSYFNITAFDSLANNIAESITKGMRVSVSGTLQQRSWEDKEGNKRSSVEIVADEVSPSMRWASARVERNPREGSAPVKNAPDHAPAYNENEEPF